MRISGLPARTVVSGSSTPGIAWARSSVLSARRVERLSRSSPAISSSTGLFCPPIIEGWLTASNGIGKAGHPRADRVHEVVDRKVALVPLGELHQDLGQVDALARLADDRLDLADGGEDVLQFRQVLESLLGLLDPAGRSRRGCIASGTPAGDRPAPCPTRGRPRFPGFRPESGEWTNRPPTTSSTPDGGPAVLLVEHEHPAVAVAAASRRPGSIRARIRASNPCGDPFCGLRISEQSIGVSVKEMNSETAVMMTMVMASGPMNSPILRLHHRQGEEHDDVRPGAGQHGDERFLATRAAAASFGSPDLVEPRDDGLQHDDRVGHQDADRHADGDQGRGVQRVAGHLHEEQADDDRQRHGDRDHEQRSEVVEKQEQDPRRQQNALRRR